ncbi:methyltransferase domain-containing protein [Actinomadura harenae]|uniref:Protein-L-isoaspartate O-methyltransferase n=1 Tax=Actinomadura harenae TaxID=2483351 RepID=A0A3M2LQC8_9ACTN|nr:methyltransferase domain-containing protein [Actinomadura harenae]RMI39649.1 methyltransferase domain-containing protein [Actinomadura harenae]
MRPRRTVDPGDAITAVRREDFIPDEIFVLGEHGTLVPLNRHDAPERWREQVRRDEPVVIQVRPDPTLPPGLCDPATGRGMESTSSSSQPSLMVEMIDMLELEPGMRVLEIGTGTGYNAALLAYLLGGDHVVSVEIDPDVAGHARAALRRAGYPVRVITANGKDGYPPAAPYDGVIVTAAAHTVPYAWVEQTRPGGVILVPWAETVHPDGRLARFVVNPDGTAEGRLIAQAFFMPLRDQRLLPRVGFDAVERWIKAGGPDFTRYGITVTPEGQTIWLDFPDNVIAATEFE